MVSLSNHEGEAQRLLPGPLDSGHIFYYSRPIQNLRATKTGAPKAPPKKRSERT